MLISYREGEDTERLVWDLAEFQDPFGIWFREGVLKLRGVALLQSPLRATALRNDRPAGWLTLEDDGPTMGC